MYSRVSRFHCIRKRYNKDSRYGITWIGYKVLLDGDVGNGVLLDYLFSPGYVRVGYPRWHQGVEGIHPPENDVQNVKGLKIKGGQGNRCNGCYLAPIVFDFIWTIWFVNLSTTTLKKLRTCQNYCAHVEKIPPSLPPPPSPNWKYKTWDHSHPLDTIHPLKVPFPWSW